MWGDLVRFLVLAKFFPAQILMCAPRIGRLVMMAFIQITIDFEAFFLGCEAHAVRLKGLCKKKSLKKALIPLPPTGLASFFCAKPDVV